MFIKGLYNNNTCCLLFPLTRSISCPPPHLAPDRSLSRLPLPSSQEKETLWSPTPEVCRQRLKRYTVPVDEQGIWESELLWAKVSKEIERDDQVGGAARGGRACGCDWFYLWSVYFG